MPGPAGFAVQSAATGDSSGKTSETHEEQKNVGWQVS